MTTTANKQGLRKAAEQRRSKHDQRTPLPPKGGVEKVDVPEYAEQYGRMTQPELRRAAKVLGIKSVMGVERGKLLTAILRKERELRAAEAESEPREAKPAAALPLAEGSRSASKAAPIRDFLTEKGWSTTLFPAEGTTAEEDILELTAKRGDEVLWISWTKGVLTTEPMPSYTIADRTIKLRNASAVKQYAAREPEAGTKELERVASNRFFRKRPTEPKRSKLPFDPALATDEEVLTALIGKAVAWHNQYRETEETAVVGVRGGKQPVELREREDGQRVLWFCCPDTGFRAFALSQLTHVGGGKKRKAVN